MSARHPFQVGDRVVCIDDSGPKSSNNAPLLELGVVYTVTRAHFGVLGSSDGLKVAGVCLAESAFADEPRNGWSAARFELHERASRP